MKNLHVIGLGLGIALTAGCQTMQSVPSLADVEAAEGARFAAFVSADPAAMKPLLAADLVYCHSTGRCQNREELMASIVAKETIYRGMDVVELKSRAVAEAVVVNGKLHVTVESAGKTQQFDLIYTDVYVKRDGRWQMTAWQSTRAP
ncbi:MAG: nuclear transport factor 2 family protein [Gammaproteobacteria bacterium]